MVNKQYTVQNVIRKSPTEMTDGGPSLATATIATTSKSSTNRNNITVISRIPNPQQKYSSGMSTDVLKSSHAQEIQPGVFGRNLTTYRDDEYAMADNDDDRGSNGTSKEMCISDIGRFQYILQMDREMGTQNSDSLYRFSADNQTNSATNTINNKSFWKADSKPTSSSQRSSASYTPKLCRYHQLYRYREIIWKKAKWLLALLVVTGIVGIILYIFELEAELQAERAATQPTEAEDLIASTNSNFTIEQLRNAVYYNGINQTNGKYLNNVQRPAVGADNAGNIRPSDTVRIGYPGGRQSILSRSTVQTPTITTLPAVTYRPNTSTARAIKETDFNANSNNGDWRGVNIDKVVVISPQPKATLAPKSKPTFVPKYTVSVTSTVTGTTSTSAIKTNSKDRNAITILSGIDGQHHNSGGPIDGPPVDDDDRLAINRDRPLRIMYPSKETLQNFGFTSGHQNNFGVPIEEDERILRMLNAQLAAEQRSNDNKYVSTTDLSVYRTKVSPTLPILKKIDATTEAVQRVRSNGHDGVCQSTSLVFCREILQYDLTNSKSPKNLTVDEKQEFDYLIQSNCSLRAHEFLCSVLEPECRPQQMGNLLPCRRVCKAILEPCAAFIAASEILSATFDCDIYPDSLDENECRDTTRDTACYTNEFQCKDKTCIPSQWQCDNIKDCSEAEDEESCTFCEPDEYRCPGTDKCITEKWYCDGNKDCPDGADEQDCYSNENWTYDTHETTRFYPLTNDKSSKSKASRPYDTVSGVAAINNTESKFQNTIKDSSDGNGYAKKAAKPVRTFSPSASSAYDETEEILSAASGIVIPVSKTLDNFQDSKEIMMTSDSKADYKYSTIDRSAAKVADAADAAVADTKTTTTATCSEGELRCINGYCITLSQLCDKVTDCPDGADEAMCVYST